MPGATGPYIQTPYGAPPQPAKKRDLPRGMFIDKSGEVLGNVQCNSADLEPGQTQALNCIPDGKYGNYTKVTAEATF
jgi:hypothetical protein